MSRMWKEAPVRTVAALRDQRRSSRGLGILGDLGGLWVFMRSPEDWETVRVYTGEEYRSDI